jgi:hypothetical protein
MTAFASGKTKTATHHLLGSSAGVHGANLPATCAESGPERSKPKMMLVFDRDRPASQPLRRNSANLAPALNPSPVLSNP